MERWAKHAALTALLRPAKLETLPAEPPPLPAEPPGPSWWREAPEPPAANAAPLGSDNKGRQMLERLGWDGAGLGASGGGRVEPVAVGLGAAALAPGCTAGVGAGRAAEDDPYAAFQARLSQGYRRR